MFLRSAWFRCLLRSCNLINLEILFVGKIFVLLRVALLSKFKSGSILSVHVHLCTVAHAQSYSIYCLYSNPELNDFPRLRLLLQDSRRRRPLPPLPPAPRRLLRARHIAPSFPARSSARQVVNASSDHPVNDALASLLPPTSVCARGPWFCFCARRRGGYFEPATWAPAPFFCFVLGYVPFGLKPVGH